MNPATRFFFVLLAVSFFCCAAIAQPSPQSSTSAQGAVPRLVNFSGRAMDAQGKPISGVAGVTFAIYKTQDEGSPLWLETQNVQADAKGNYTIQLGATKSEGLPLDLFSAAEARWLGVRVNGGEEQPRVLLLSVPYALKAADAETIGGLPPSAFVLAAPAISGGTNLNGAPASAWSAAVPPPAASNVTTTGGTVNTIPLFSAAANIQNSILTQTGTTSVNVAGKLNLPATGAATAAGGKSSHQETFVASSFSSSSSAAVNQTFELIAEPLANNTATPSGTLNLLYGSGTTTPAQTGLKIGSNGVITFAPGQTFPGGSGTGTVTSVGLTAPTTDFSVTGSPVTSAGTLNFAWKVVPTASNTPNAIVKRNAAGAFAAGEITGTSEGASTAGVTGQNGVTGYGLLGLATGTAGQGVWGESTGTGNSNGASSDGVHGVTHTANGSGVAGLNSDAAGIGVYGQGGGYGVYAVAAATGRELLASGTGVYGGSGTGAGVSGNSSSGVGVYGSGGSWAFQSAGNVNQDRASGGWVKAMLYVNAAMAPYKIVRCFNSTLTGAAASTPPCGFNLTETSTGVFDVTFNFEVDDRFWSATGSLRNIITTGSAAAIINVDNTGLGADDLDVFVQDSDGNPTIAYFNLIIY
jgi:trimeric autotransporter adhesin